MDTFHTLDELIDFSRILHNTHNPFRPLPEGWRRIDKVVIPRGGFYAVIYAKGAQTVVSISGQRPHRPLFLFDMIRRRLKNTYSPAISDWAREFVKTKPNVTFIGASGGGGVASWLGGLFNRPSATFNGGRTKMSLLNDGTKQDVVYIKGDGWGDPHDGKYHMPMPGNEIILHQKPGEETHYMAAITPLLEAKRAEARSAAN